MSFKFIFLFCILFISLRLFSQNSLEKSVPFSVDSTHLTVWNGEKYIPFFVKGVNLGIAKPGTFPGNLEASKAQYARWFTDIKDAGFNCIRLYTLHYPHFYQVLDSFNRENKSNPLLIMQGVWLNEELPGYDHDLFFMTDTFKVEIEENINALHGNCVIGQRYGKAYGTYTTDASTWNLAYIIGREVYPNEVITTNTNHSTFTSYSGNYLSLANGTPAANWFTSVLDHLLTFEQDNYQTQRPVSTSSWPTLDPISHMEEINRDEDTVSVDLSQIDFSNAPAGIFMSYHAYPYYPDFISDESTYQSGQDNYGPNSYVAYLTKLKEHYSRFPLIIAEFGVPSSLGIAHYTSSGMNHGGFDEENQGNTNIRMMHSIQNSLCGGGIQFAWMDEWFKRTWVTDPFDYSNRNLWHNITAAEQNFGLIKFEKENSLSLWENFPSSVYFKDVQAKADYTFLNMEIGLNEALENPEEIWIAFDTYEANLGESILPNGDVITNRAEFALRINNHSASLYVTEAYDLYGIWHNISGPNQKFQSTATDGAPWNIVRWKNNSGNAAIQYIGELNINYGFQPESSLDAVTIFDSIIRIKLPWSLLNIEDPSHLRVIHDDRLTPEREDSLTDGIAITLSYKNELTSTNSRFSWDPWTAVTDADFVEIKKTSYWIMKERLTEFNTKAIAKQDAYTILNTGFPQLIAQDSGVLINDFDLDGNNLTAILTEIPAHGNITLNPDGSFEYLADFGFTGTDSFRYSVFDGYSISASNKVNLTVGLDSSQLALSNKTVIAYPNPTQNSVYLKSSVSVHQWELFDSRGLMIWNSDIYSKELSIDLTKFESGLYYLKAHFNDVETTTKIIRL